MKDLSPGIKRLSLSKGKENRTKNTTFLKLILTITLPRDENTCQCHSAQ